MREASHFVKGAPGWMVVLSGTRITNKNKTVRVTLGPSLLIQKSPSHWLYADELPAQTFKPDHPAGQPKWLRTPVKVEPTDVETGLVGFWLSPLLAGDGALDPEIATLNEPDGKAELTLVDYVSNKKVTLTVPGSYP